MAIYGIEGGIGTGKTLTLVYLGVNDWKNGKMLYSNVRLKGLRKRYRFLNLEIMKEMFKNVKDKTLNMDNSTIIIQEMHNYLDSRNSASLHNKTLSYWILQSRHFGNGASDIIYDSQEVGQVDKRLRRNTDFLLRPMIIKKIDGRPHIIRVEGIGKIGHKMETFSFVFCCEQILNIYDTHEIVDF